MAKLKLQSASMKHSIAGTNLTLSVHVHRHGQEEPRKSDKLVARGILYLPCNPDSEYLADEIRYEHRVAPCEMSLIASWGYSLKTCGDAAITSAAHQPNTRYMTRLTTGNTWDEALEECKKEMHIQANKLLEAATRRYNILRDADND